MSEPKPEKGVIGVTFLKYIILAMLIIGGAVIGFYIGNILGTLVGSTQIYQGYVYGGLFQLLYNATHVLQYANLATIAPGLGVTTATSLVQGFEIIGLVMGLLGGIIGGILVYRKIELYEE